MVFIHSAYQDVFLLTILTTNNHSTTHSTTRTQHHRGPTVASNLLQSQSARSCLLAISYTFTLNTPIPTASPLAPPIISDIITSEETVSARERLRLLRISPCLPAYLRSTRHENRLLYLIFVALAARRVTLCTYHIPPFPALCIS